MSKTNIRLSQQLRGKTVVVTGASSGAGMAIALEFAKYETKLVLASRNPEALEELETMCRSMGSVTVAVKVDTTDAAAVQQLAVAAMEFGDSIDIWVNNAGVLAAGAFADTPVEVHKRVVQTNLLGYMYGAHAVMPYFKRQQHGVLINNISVAGFLAVPYGAAYTATKFGLRGFSEALRGELGTEKNIHVCDLYPAFLDTPGIQHAANYTGKMLRPAPPVYDPQYIARAAVRLAVFPKESVNITSLTPFLKLAIALFPVATRSITARVIEGYLKKAEDASKTSGNLFAPAKFGTSIHGGWNSPADAEIRKKLVIKSAVILGIAASLITGAKIALNKSKNQ